MSLRDIYNNYAASDCTLGSDKNTTHQYLNVYEEIFNPLEKETMSVLEIGTFSGAWLEVMQKFFINANIYGMDIDTSNTKFGKGLPRVTLYECDATKESSLELVKNESFRVIIDDGSHLENDILKTFDLYYSKLDKNGIYIIEDVSSSYYNNIVMILKEKCDRLELSMEIKDLRHITGRYDDIMILISMKKS
jgi:hypothetical protein